ncbi:hypothetical protein H9L10_01630 [Phycicoccus endophyticus]|uniref:Uncharacterized protein n=1 Tax=Phycicoccus endophyticus TaxID=1690220 RepID=A0A7G9R2J7_9MICO|nr:hypothetical protein [Phycicoccus endophyticus]NHI20720.1 hypothetical protein [Phycicoccus endophyticus]QNN49822.1 hypothetical protein H9L10_01630 [Phycicoccus endophyticus]GGL35420.1 hypothetical protein GCM10012283_17330 [Phycicoccus endophyticus]
MNDSPPDATTGFLAFLAFAFLALALWFLMRNMNDRMRRMSYRQQRAGRGRNEAQAGPEDVAEPPAQEPAAGPDPEGGQPTAEPPAEDGTGRGPGAGG